MKYIFGNYKHQSSNTWECNAKNITSAINQFKVSVLFPEQYCEGSFYENNSKYDEILEITIPKEITSEMFIPVYEWTDEIQKQDKEYNQNHKGEKYLSWYQRFQPTLKLKVEDCIKLNYSSLEKPKALSYIPTEVDSTEIVPQQKSSSLVLTDSKVTTRNRYTDLMQKKQELEQQRQELMSQLSEFEKEIKQKQKRLYALETYMGIEEEVIVLQEGQKASNDEPIHVYQLKLYMDEEVGITELDDPTLSSGLDFNNIELFDEWIIQHYQQYLYQPKSIMAWEIKRNDSHYSDDYLYNEHMNKQNHLTYFLIRNGDMLYRIYTNVYVGDTTFPTKKAFDAVVKEDEEWHRHGEGIRKYVERNMYILIALQGLIDRTDIFGTNLTGKVNLIDPTKFDDTYVKLVRDAEFENLITDGRPSWIKWKNQNQSTIQVGSRVMFFVPSDGRWGNGRRDLQDRVVSNNRYSDFLPVPRNRVYQIIEKDSYRYKFKFDPSDDSKIWVKDENGNVDYRARKNKMSFWAYDSELLNIDEITFEDVDYYLHTRAYRKHYLDFLPVLKQIYTQKKQEEQEEQPFVELLKSKFNFDNEREIKVMINYWKTKNKWKRSISVNDQKAYRMIGSWIKRFQQTEQ